MKLKDYILARDVVNSRLSLADVRNKIMRFNPSYYEKWYRICYEPLLKLKKDVQSTKKIALQGLSVEQLRQLKKYQETIFNELKEIQKAIDTIDDPGFAEQVQENGIIWDQDRLRFKDTITEFSATTDDQLWQQGLYRFDYMIKAYQRTIQSKQFVLDLNNPQQVQFIKAQQELINDVDVALKSYKQSSEGLILLSIIGGIL